MCGEAVFGLRARNDHFSLDLEARRSQDFLEGGHHAGGLPAEEIEREGGRAARNDIGVLTLVERFWDPEFGFAHQRVHHAVEKRLERARHVAPVHGGGDHQHVAVEDLLGDPVRIVLGQTAGPALAALHATPAGRELQVVHVHDFHLRVVGEIPQVRTARPVGEAFYRLRNGAVPARTRVQNQDFHAKPPFLSI